MSTASCRVLSGTELWYVLFCVFAVALPSHHDATSIPSPERPVVLLVCNNVCDMHGRKVTESELRSLGVCAHAHYLRESLWLWRAHVYVCEENKEGREGRRGNKQEEMCLRMLRERMHRAVDGPRKSFGV